MDFKNNNGQERDDIIQNRITAYLLSSVNRKRRSYIIRKEEIEKRESPLSQTGGIAAEEVESQFMDMIPIHMQLKNDRLVEALFELSEREKYIFLQHTLCEESFGMLAKELGLSYKGVAAIYYRTMQKVREYMRRDNDEL